MAARASLDDPGIYELDAEGMGELIAGFPGQVREAAELAASIRLPGYRELPRGVAVVGMGGSAIAADLAAGLPRQVPLLTVRGYALPPFVDQSYLVIASSHSGDTEETLAAFAEAGQRGCARVAITTGGRLAEQAGDAGLPLVTYSYAGPPRAALGLSLLLLLGTLERAGLRPAVDLAPVLAAVEEVASRCRPESPSGSNPAKQLAGELPGRIPITYGAQHLAAVARRWKGQFNENAKSFSAWEELPEADHNAVVGYEHPRRAPVSLILLESQEYHPRVALRLAATAELAAERGHPVHRGRAQGRGPLTEMLSLVHLGDWVSYYLALLNGVDPTPIPAIERLKAALADQG